MFIDLPTIQRLTPPIRRSTRIDECQLVPYSGSIVGRICVPAGGGEVSSLALSESFRCRPERKFLPTLMRLAVVLAPLLVASLFWAYRYHTSSAAGQSRDRGSVIGFAIKVPTDRSHR